MKTRYRLAVGLAVLALSMGTATAKPFGPIPGGGKPWPRAPEISTAAGPGAVALITGILLLRSERSKTRRSSDPR
ncbi:hypothetical protein SAMN02949497_3213 [Methylomagnum ishizawai]|uniref:PEP-CTERM protein-sorting domain-containing protein n=1 Tax=Methylomagnum ishizawai TaxID=1760988 RepID=A0A1Y6CYU1_9GAMM|nr:hypothetical protein [Methylomagnum ishizawai]SMF95838.1 hypothetical protein SAMN02949497_3213 [Methylomagnum ishizawai]